MLDNITIGADPEFFLRRKGNRQYISAHDLVPGTKQEPHKLKCGGMVQADGTAVEFNIPPATTEQEFCESISDTLSEIREMVDPKLEFAFEPAVFYTEKYFDTIPAEAKILGCEPDFSCFTGEQNVIQPLINKYKRMRTGAGHIHIGWTDGVDIGDENHRLDCEDLAFFLNRTVQPLINHITPRNPRNKLYGGNGAYRVKPYGMEFREPSNFWVGDSGLYPMIYNIFKNAVKSTQSYGSIDHMKHVIGRIKQGNKNWLNEYKVPDGYFEKQKPKYIHSVSVLDYSFGEPGDPIVEPKQPQVHRYDYGRPRAKAWADR